MEYQRGIRININVFFNVSNCYKFSQKVKDWYVVNNLINVFSYYIQIKAIEPNKISKRREITGMEF